ncbi:MAG: threonine synthase [Chloroflexota bacterium]
MAIRVLGVRGAVAWRPLDLRWDSARARSAFLARVADLSLGEGNTPVVDLPRAAARVGLGRVRTKLELSNPTGSFKDRGAWLLVGAARTLGAAEVVEDSSGNAGAAVAAYAARAGLKAYIFVPADTPPAKLAQARAYGAQVVAVPGPREAATQAAVNFAREKGLFYASHNRSPFFTEGMVGFGEELLRLDPPPTDIVVPVGNGSLVAGIWLAYRRAGRWPPRIHGVQAEGCAPLAEAWERGLPEPVSVSPGPTVAGGIRVERPPRGAQVLGMVRASGGSMVKVADTDILDWAGFLSEKEGIFAEPTSAAAFAGLARLIRLGRLGVGADVLVPVTGSGLKAAIA